MNDFKCIDLSKYVDQDKRMDCLNSMQNMYFYKWG